MCINRDTLYLHDYNFPSGFRLAIEARQRVACPIIQNGYIYDEWVFKYGFLKDYRDHLTPSGRVNTK